jgi:hypothetical protein
MKQNKLKEEWKIPKKHIEFYFNNFKVNAIIKFYKRKKKRREKKRGKMREIWFNTIKREKKSENIKDIDLELVLKERILRDDNELKSWKEKFFNKQYLFEYVDISYNF